MDNGWQRIEAVFIHIEAAQQEVGWVDDDTDQQEQAQGETVMGKPEFENGSLHSVRRAIRVAPPKLMRPRQHQV
jgi:hypothetical protein